MKRERKNVAPGGAGAPSLDTEGVTVPVTPEEKHNSTPSRLGAWSSSQSPKNSGSRLPESGRTPRPKRRKEDGEPVGKNDAPRRMPRAARAALAAGRRSWLEQLDALTQLYRYRRAAELEKRGRALAEQRRKVWQRGEVLEPNDRDALIESLLWQARDEQELDVRAWLIDAAGAVNESSTLPSFSIARSYTGRPRALPPLTTQWHDARAEAKRELFERVDECAEDARVLRLVCRGTVPTAEGVRPCGHSENLPIGCGSQHFCASCRVQLAQRFRVDFERKRLGLVGQARQAQLTGRFRRRAKGGRFGEKLLTLTLPHWGNPSERVEQLRETWPRFWRLLSDELRPQLAALPAGIRTVDDDRFDRCTGEVKEYKRKGGKKARAARAAAGLPDSELSLWDLVSYLWVFEWTPGADGLGHPHLHVWLFAPFLPVDLLQRLWVRAFCDVSGHQLVAPLEGSTLWRVARVTTREDGVNVVAEPVPLVVDVRAAWELERDGGSVGNEIVKYLTKDWEISDDGVHRAHPEVFAQVYTAIEGRRGRQSSAGLQRWALERHVACPVCGFENDRGHWAFAFLPRSPLETQHPPEERRTVPELATGPPGPESHVEQVARAYWEQREQEWLASAELRVLQGRWRQRFPDLVRVQPSAPSLPRQGVLF